LRCALVAAAPPQLPRLDSVQLHGNLIGVAVGITAFSVLLFGVLPALFVARVNLASPLRADARSGTESQRRRQMRDWLVASQIALALLMLSGAALLTRRPVPKPILCSPYEEPDWYWRYDMRTGAASKTEGRREASYWFRSQRTSGDSCRSSRRRRTIRCL
jgi:hypothetical protein